MTEYVSAITLFFFFFFLTCETEVLACSELGRACPVIFIYCLSRFNVSLLGKHDLWMVGHEMSSLVCRITRVFEFI